MESRIRRRAGTRGRIGCGVARAGIPEWGERQDGEALARKAKKAAMMRNFSGLLLRGAETKAVKQKSPDNSGLF